MRPGSTGRAMSHFPRCEGIAAGSAAYVSGPTFSPIAHCHLHGGAGAFFDFEVLSFSLHP